jgi:flagellar biosynthesis protein
MRRCNIKNLKKAAALGYDPKEGVPRILASGRGREAEHIVALAKTAGITIMEDGALAALLDAVEPGDFIPPWCWEAAARILAFVISKEKK